MALWGTADSIYSPGTIDLVYGTKTITGTGTSFTSAYVGSVIHIGAGSTVGKAVIKTVTNATTISIASTQFLSGVAVAGLAYTCSEEPIYTLGDSTYNSTHNSTNDVVGVDIYETAAVRDTDYSGGDTGYKYAVTHAGWVGVHTYVDMHGNLRVKSETLVAMSGITTNLPPSSAAYATTGDANDDTAYPDRTVTFLTQPNCYHRNWNNYCCYPDLQLLWQLLMLDCQLSGTMHTQSLLDTQHCLLVLSSAMLLDLFLELQLQQLLLISQMVWTFRAVVTGDGVSAESAAVGYSTN